MKKTNGFGLMGVIIIIIVTAVISGIATGVIMLNNSNTKIDLISNDEDLQEFVEVYKTLLSKYYDNVDKDAMLKAAEEGMVNFLRDKYTTYLEDEEYQDILDDLGETYNGVGIEIQGNLIVSVTKDSPAEKAGIMANDILQRVNGTDVTNATSEFIGNLIKNNNDETVSIEVNRNNQILTFNVAKAKLENKAISHNIDNNVGYLVIRKFSETLGSQVSKALNEMESKGINSLIIDVRDNVGGYLSAAEDTASLFLEKGKVIYSLQSSNSDFTYKDETKESRSYPIVVLVNGNSASASEILAAALKESYGAKLVGTKTYGKGKVQQIAELGNGDSVKYTSAKWLTPTGNCIDGVGIAPDYNVDGYELQYNKAMEILTTN